MDFPERGSCASGLWPICRGRAVILLGAPSWRPVRLVCRGIWFHDRAQSKEKGTATRARLDIADSGAARDFLLSRLAQTYGGALARFFERRVQAKADVPDLVQDVFLRLSRMPDPAAIEKPEHFLFVTAANVLKDRARRDAVRGGGLHDEWIEGALAKFGFSARSRLGEQGSGGTPAGGAARASAAYA